MTPENPVMGTDPFLKSANESLDVLVQMGTVRAEMYGYPSMGLHRLAVASVQALIRNARENINDPVPHPDEITELLEKTFLLGVIMARKEFANGIQG